MGSTPNSRHGSSPTPDSAAPPASERFRDVWDADGSTRAVVDASGARMTFTYDVRSRTVIQFPTGGRVTLAWCRSQMTTDPATLSYFAAHLELRSQATPESTNARAGAFLAHPETQHHVTAAANRALGTPSKRRRLLEDVVQEAFLHLLDDLIRGKLNFDGDDPQRFVRWFRGTSRHVVVDAIKLCLCTFAPSGFAATTADAADSNAVDPAEIAMFRELFRLAVEEIERIPETELREAMRDLRHGVSTRDSARRLRVSKSAAGRDRKRGCRMIADTLGN